MDKKTLFRCPYRKSISTYTHEEMTDTSEMFEECHGPSCALYDERFLKNCVRAAKETKEAMQLLTFEEYGGLK